MRTIDADALIDKYGDWYTEEGTEEGYIGTIKGIVDSMPTIEPERKKGEWIVTSEFEDCYYAKCNQCNITQVFYFNTPLTNFCPDCGSLMVVK